MLSPECADRIAIAGQQGRRHQLLEAQDEELLRRVAHRGGVVDDERSVFRQQLEQMRRADIGHVEGRVLAHQDDIDAGEVELLERAEAVVVALPSHDFERPRAGVEPPVVKRQRVG